MSTPTEATPPRAINWFEIPVSNLERAQAFYERTLGRGLRRESAGPNELAVFPYGEGATGGCLMAGPGMPAPGAGGLVVYLNAEPSLDAALERAMAAGGRLAQPRVELPDGMGAFAHVVDPEGNRIGLHALA